MKLILCNGCAHLQESGPVWRCAAFDGPIPEAILNGRVSHKEAYPGDGGVVYERGPEERSPGFWEAVVEMREEVAAREPPMLMGIDDDGNMHDVRPFLGPRTTELVELPRPRAGAAPPVMEEQTMREFFFDNAAEIDRVVGTGAQGELRDILEAGTRQARATLPDKVRGVFTRYMQNIAVLRIDEDGPATVRASDALLLLDSDEIVVAKSS